MQKLLPYLEQRITNTILLEESAEELQKMKILQRVLCGQEAVDDRYKQMQPGSTL